MGNQSLGRNSCGFWAEVIDWLKAKVIKQNPNSNADFRSYEFF
jgi:hypothetical protein